MTAAFVTQRGETIIPERFWAWVDKTPANGCWLWTGQRAGRSRTSNYGRYGNKGMAHRLAYELAVGPIPPGLELDHLCRTQRCVNPAHLEPVTPEENRRRRREAQTHCKREHEFTPENTYMTGIGARQCRACCVIRARKSSARKAVA